MKTCPKCGASGADNSVFCMNCGARFAEPAPTVKQPEPAPAPAPAAQTYNTYNTYNTNPAPVIVNNVVSDESYFDGTLGQQIGISIVTVLLCMITLGIYAPWGFCRLFTGNFLPAVLNDRLLRRPSLRGSFSC